MISHFEECHKVIFYVPDSGEMMFVLGDFDPKEDRSASKGIVFDGHVFFLYYHNNVGARNLKVTVDAYFVGKPTKKYFVNVKYSNDNFVQHKTIRPIIMKGESNMDGLKMILESDENVEEFCMKVPQKFLYHLLSFGSFLTCSIKFFVK